MPRVHPKSEPISFDCPELDTPAGEKKKPHRPSVVLTVWRKSLVLTCTGFTVFDGKGNLVYRVDKYAADNRAEVVLMDSTGEPLSTIRRKRLCIGDQWTVYQGDAATNIPIYSVKKHLSLRNSKRLARVTTGSGAARGITKQLIYEIEGSYGQRSCTIYNENLEVVAEILRKESVTGADFGGEVFRLVVQPEMDSAVAMALVIVLDRMFRSSSSS